jgi:hypothetical protein
MWPDITYSDSTFNHHYFNFRLGTELKTKWEKMTLTATMSNYVAAKDSLNYQQRRIFTNLDLGVKFKLGDNFYFTAKTPLSISPVYGWNGRWLYVGENRESVKLQRNHVGVSGLMLGLTYQFGNKKKKNID